MDFPDYGARFRARIVPLLCFIVFFSVLNGTMFNVAVPDIAAEFSLSPVEVSWVVTGYIVVFALASVVYGKLADSRPVRNLITIGLLLFNAGALLGFFSSWYPALILARLLQASGGGAIPAMGMLVATRYFPPERRGQVLGAVASTVAFAAGVGPVAGGFIGGHFHWRYLFLLSAATLVAIPLFRRLLPIEERSAGRFDLGGAALLGGGVGFLLLFAAQGTTWGLAAGVLLVGGFAVRLRRAEHPFVPPVLFGNRHYRGGLVTAFLAVGSVFGMFFIIPLLLRQVHQLGTWEIGLVIFPGAMSAAVLGNVGGRLADRVGSSAVVAVGLSLLICGLLLLARFAGAGPSALASCLVVGYVGFSVVQASLAKTVSLALPLAQTGVGMGFYNLVFFTAGAFGAAFVGHLLELGPRLFPRLPTADVYRVILSFLAFIAAAALALFAASRRKPHQA